MKKSRPTTREVERGEVLRYLAEVYPSLATLRSLVNHLDYSGYSVSAEDLEFHLWYLAEKGFVEIDEYPREAGERRQIRGAKITPAGVDLLDHRKKGDPGVRF
jgi:hypothetical protein